MSTDRTENGGQFGLVQISKPSGSEPDIGFATLLKWVWCHSKTKIVIMVLAMVSTAGISTLSAYILLLARDFINAATQGDDHHIILRHVGLLIAVLVGISILKLISSAFGAIAATTIRRDLEVSCFKRLGRLSFDYLSRNPSGRITTAVMAEIPLAASITGIVLRSFIRSPLSLLAAAIVLYFNTPIVAVMAIVIAPILGFGLKTFSRLVRQATSQAFTAISTMYARLNEQLRGIKTVHSLGLLNLYTQKLTEQAYTIAIASQKSVIYGALHQSVQEFLAMLIFASLLFWLSHKVGNGTMELGQALLVPAALVFMKNEAMKVSGGIIQLNKIKGAVTRLATLLDTPTLEHGDISLDNPLKHIRLHDVSFEYKDGSHVLEHINIELCQGLTVVIGESGSGKSTLCDLCLRLQHPSSGTIYYNDTPLPTLKDNYIRAHSALVEQEPFLFEGSLRYNLTLEYESVSDEELKRVLQLAGADTFVDRLPQGLDSELGPNGVSISVGEKQRIVIARALLRDPHFLVLDEFTSALDKKTEMAILTSIVELSKELIILCTSHRESIIKHANRVYTISDQKLIDVTAEASDYT